MRVPPHAAVGETVALARDWSTATGRRGFVNAVLRRVSERDAGRRGVDAVAPDAGRRSARTSRWRDRHPDWVVRAFRAALLGAGAATGTTSTRPGGPARGRQRRRRRSRSSPGPGWRRRTSWCARSATAYRPVAVRRSLDGGDPGAIPAVRDGPGRRAGRGQPARRARASPARRAEGGTGAGGGGSTCAPARAARRRCSRRSPLERGATCSPTRSATTGPRLVRHRSARPWPTRGDTVCVGHRRRPRRRRWRSGRQGYDRVLLDAPCTGLGALRRRPEARWRRTPADVADLGDPAARAAGLGRIAARYAPAGWCGYATCSPAPGRDAGTSSADAVSARRGRRSDVRELRRRGGSFDRVDAADLGGDRRRGRTCSSGRTSTAPTGCSWRCWSLRRERHATRELRRYVVGCAGTAAGSRH